MGINRQSPKFILQLVFQVAFREASIVDQVVDETIYVPVLVREHILFVIHGVGCRFLVSDFSGEGCLYRHGKCKVSSSIFWPKALFGRARPRCR
jgi:hypothetical protein